MTAFVRVIAAAPVGKFVVRVTFSNGETREVDLEAFLHGPIFDRVRNDPAFFNELGVDRELGTITWPNGADIDPDVLFQGLQPAWRTEPSQAHESGPEYGGSK
ncbi:MAG: DUF2442 domain-containing protein [Acidobacteria bacterium]|nr:DUF2442 domain-containing protein [Acidobacteriota bacterium]